VGSNLIDKAAEALRKSMESTKKALEALDHENLEATEFPLWKAAAESEYASFILSVAKGLNEPYAEAEDLRLDNPSPKPTIIAAEQALSEALKLVGYNLEEAYQKSKLATKYLRKASSTLTTKPSVRAK